MPTPSLRCAAASPSEGASALGSGPARTDVTTIRYTRVAISLHWLIALAIFANLALGFYMADLEVSPQKLRLYS